ncbi:MAG TPA: ExeM/NucH family extracellular endonuclease [Thermoanaerobaculia bacterium]|jgi:uncharacterized repeat protein (TIGR01451 family)|nr:ExeM/NucH family extracellular endonuclease [Thermoanaerobaculia bacterium]
MRFASRLSLVLGTVLLLATAATRPAAAQLVINEIDYDQIGTDSAEFLELKNVSGGVVNLDNYTVQLVNGNGGGAAVYDTIDLPNVNLAAGDYYVICANAATVPGCDLDDGPDTDFIQNGSPDAIGLRLSGVLVDTVSYEGNSGAPYTETTGTPTATASDSNTVAFIGLSRFPDGTDSNNNSADLSLRCITPGAANASAATGCAAPPVLPDLTVNDVSLDEGNAGTTIFTFTVSLSAPAGPGGVTFDIATADGTAAAPGDYAAKSLTGQTIPAGSSTYSFTVLVNGDVAVEPGETFFVNVTNVTGANVTDNQGLGTIQNDDAPNLTIDDVPLNEGNAGTTTFTFTVSLSSPAPPGGVTFDIATADGTATAPSDYTAKSLTGQTIPAGSSTYTFDVLVNGDITPEGDETFLVNVTNVTNAIAADTQGQGTILNDDLSKIHDVQGNGAATPIPGATVMVEGVVTADFQGSLQLHGFFLQEEDADVDADPQTSEGIFIFCSSCPTPVAEGQRVKVTGTVSEFNNMTEITAGSAGSVMVTDAGNHLAEVTPAPVDLPIGGDVNAFYETLEGMLVTFVDTLTVSEYFELARYGQILLYEGGRPFQFTETSPPSVAGNTAHQDAISRREVILDDDNNTQEWYLPSSMPPGPPDGSQFVFHPRANGGFSVGTQGTDFFRGGDLVNGLTGVLHWSFPGFGADTWRIRPTAAHPVAFTVADPRPATPPAVGGAIKAVSMNLLNYFTTVDTTSGNTGPCGPSGGQDCRGADSVAELNRQRERASVVVCGLNADIYAFMELENTTPSDTITDLLGAINARCGGAHPYAFVNTGGTLGTDAIRVQLIYRTGIVSPVGSPLVDLDPVHNRPPTAQTFDVVDSVNPAFGERFTVIANHFKSKGCPGSGADADAGDGQGCFNGTRVAQANRLLTWINGTVLPAAGDPDVLLLGDFNSYAMEDPVTTLEAGGFTDLESAILGPAAYSYLFDSQLGHLDYAFANSSLTPRVTGVGAWHINADEAPLFDYNDEVKDTGESAFEEKPDGSALVPPRVVFQPASPYRASDHDPVLVGLFAVADLSITKDDLVDPVTAGNFDGYTISVTNQGPNDATDVVVMDPLPAGVTYQSVAPPPGWSCTPPAVGTNGTVTCSTPNLANGALATINLVVRVDSNVPSGTVLMNTATVTSAGDGNSANDSSTEPTTVDTSAGLSVTKVDDPDPVVVGQNITYTITVNNAGPSNAASVTLSDTLSAGTTFVSLTSPGGWSCTTPSVGLSGTVSCSIPSLAPGNAVFTLTVKTISGLSPNQSLTNTVMVSSTTSDPNPGNESATASTTVVADTSAVSITKSNFPFPVNAGEGLTYFITVRNNSGADLDSVTVTDPLPAGTTFQSLEGPFQGPNPAPGWTCTTPPVGSPGTVTCSAAPFPQGDTQININVRVDSSVPEGTVLSNTATLVVTEGSTVITRESTSTAGVRTPPVIRATKAASGNFAPGGTVTYTVVLDNVGSGNQGDNPGPELTDTLPAGLTLVSATATSGMATADVATRTVTWNGAIPSHTSVTITINATIDPGVAPGTTITNQGTYFFDPDRNGTNDSSSVTDNPATPVSDATSFVVGAAQSAVEIPTLDEIGLALLALLLAMGGAVMLRRRRA